MYLLLATEERIDYKYDNGIGNIVAEYATPEEAAADIVKFTPEAVKVVKFFDDNDNLMGEYRDLVFDGADVHPVYEEEVLKNYECNFRLREMSEIERRVTVLEDEVTEIQEAIVEG